MRSTLVALVLALIAPAAPAVAETSDAHESEGPQGSAVVQPPTSPRPALRVEVPEQASPGELVTIRTGPADESRPSLVTSGSRDMLDVDRQQRLEHVVADLWDGREIELGPDFGEVDWTADVEVPLGLKPGAYPITVVAIDGSGRVHRETVILNVGGRPLAMLGRPE